MDGVRQSHSVRCTQKGKNVDKNTLAQHLADAQGLVWGELDEATKQRLELTAERYIAQGEKQMMQPPQTTEVVQPPPSPPAPSVQEVITEEIPTQCGNCGVGFTFPVESNIEEFTFDCGACGATNRWKRR